jgi:hypothetical protein
MKQILIFSIFFTFLSCKHDNTVGKYVYNFTNDTITSTWENQTKIILPGDFTLVQTKLYGGATEGIPCEQDNEFILTFSSGRTLLKELDSAEAWEGNIDGNRHLFQECYFKIYEVDLQ